MFLGRRKTGVHALVDGGAISWEPRGRNWVFLRKKWHRYQPWKNNTIYWYAKKGRHKETQCTATEKHNTLILINLVEGILWLPHWTCGTLRLKGCDIWELLHVKQPLCEEDAEAIGFIQLRDKQRKVWKYTTLKSENGAWTMGSHPSCHPSCTPLKTSKHTPRAVTRVFVQTCRLVKDFNNFPPVSCY